MIDPSLWDDPDIGTLSPQARLLFIGCFSLADDRGNILADPRYLNKRVFGYDAFSTEQVDQWLSEVASLRAATLYTAEDQCYLHFNNWERYQKLDSRYAPKTTCPAFPDACPPLPVPPYDDPERCGEEAPHLSDIEQDAAKSKVKKSKVKKSEVKKSEEKALFLSQIPKPDRERIRDVLIDVLRDGVIPETDYLLRPFETGLDSLVTEFRAMEGKKRLDSDLTSKIIAAIRAAYEDRANWQFDNTTSPTRPVIECIVATGRRMKTAQTTHTSTLEAAARSQEALEQRQTQAQQHDPWWEGILQQIALQVDQHAFDQWLKNTQLVSRADGTIRVGVQNPQAKDWLENRMMSVILRTVETEGVDTVELEVMPHEAN